MAARETYDRIAAEITDGHGSSPPRCSGCPF
jgi:hypothetical protein